jgi:hypothetical protein
VDARLEVLTAVLLRSQLFSDMTPCQARSYRRFEETRCVRNVGNQSASGTVSHRRNPESSGPWELPECLTAVAVLTSYHVTAVAACAEDITRSVLLTTSRVVHRLNQTRLIRPL